MRSKRRRVLRRSIRKNTKRRSRKVRRSKVRRNTKRRSVRRNTKRRSSRRMKGGVLPESVELRDGWVAFWDPEENMYYYQHEDGNWQWENPDPGFAVNKSPTWMVEEDKSGWSPVFVTEVNFEKLWHVLGDADAAGSSVYYQWVEPRSTTADFVQTRAQPRVRSRPQPVTSEQVVVELDGGEWISVEGRVDGEATIFYVNKQSGRSQWDNPFVREDSGEG